MKKYYFTYGSSPEYPYYGGWTVVETDTNQSGAIDIYRAYHPDINKDGEIVYVNCAGIYDEEYFENTRMYTNGNLGYFEHERITATSTRIES